MASTINVKSSAPAVGNAGLRGSPAALGRPRVVLLIGGSRSLLERCRTVMSAAGIEVEHTDHPSRRAVVRLRPFLLLATRDAYLEDPVAFSRVASAAHAMLLLVAESSDELELRGLLDWALGMDRGVNGVRH